MEIILFFILIYAAKRGWDDAKAGAAKSRKAYMKRAAKKHPGMSKRQASRHALRHDAGHVLSQLFRGFPNARHGFASGWHEGRRAHAHARAEHQRAKAEHLEARASLIPDLTAYRARQRAALERIRRGAGPDMKAACSHAPAPCLTPTSCPCDCPDCMAAFNAQWEVPEEGSEGRQPTRRVDGKPETDADRRFFDLRESGYTGPIDRDGRIPDPSDPEVARQLDALDGLSSDPAEPEAAEASQSPSTTEGTTMASEVTYDGVIRAMNSAVEAAEDHGATARTAHTQAANVSDQMLALEVDPATLGAMADHLDALDAAVKAQQQVLDTARNVHETLQRGHAQLAEAHKEAVVEAADKAFYQD